MKRIGWWVAAVVAVVALFALHWYREEVGRRASEVLKENAFYRKCGIVTEGAPPFVALPPFVPHMPVKARLGAKLYQESRLVKNARQTCAGCHRPDMGGTDGKVHGGVLTRPSVNAVFAEVFLHDASVTGLVSLVKTMFEDARFGGGGSLDERLSAIRDEKRYQALCSNAYAGEGLSVSNALDAVAEYLKTLVEGNGAFDRYCGGDTNALGAVAREGFAVFTRYGCDRCHRGPAVGQRVVAGGRKVPGLRGLGGRKVYLSRGNVTDLNAVIQEMPKGEEIDDTERQNLRAFLNAL